MAITGIERAQKASVVCAIGAALLTAFACTVPRAEDAPQKDESVVLLLRSYRARRRETENRVRF